MKIVNKLAMLVVAATMFATGCVERVNVGYSGIKVNMTGSERGAEEFPKVTGWVFYMPGVSTIIEFPTFMQTAAWTGDPRTGTSEQNEAICFNTKDQLNVCADINLSYQMDEAMVSKFYTKFRITDLKDFTNGYLHNVAKDAFNDVGSLYNFDELNGEKKGIVLAKVKERLNADVSKFGVTIGQFGLLDALKPPQEIITQITAKLASIQRAQQAENELREAVAQAAKAVAKADGEAKANSKVNQSLTSNMIEWRKLENQRLAIDKWNGIQPTIVSGASSMLLNVGTGK